MYMYAYYIHTLYYMHTVDTYMTAVCINVYVIMVNGCITALACFEGYARVATLIWIAVIKTWHLCISLGKH